MKEKGPKTRREKPAGTPTLRLPLQDRLVPPTPAQAEGPPPDADTVTKQVGFDALAGDGDEEVKAFLVILDDPHLRHLHDRVIQLGPKTMIGRASNLELHFDDPALSRIHACVYLDDDGQWILSDLGSQNGTFVNSRRVKTVELNDGDKIHLGQTTFKFVVSYPLE